MGDIIWKKFNGACVTIISQFIRRDGSPLFTSGSGFFVTKNGHICTAAHNIMSLDKSLKREAGDCNIYVFADNIRAGLSSFNGKPAYRSIKLELVGIAGAADVAILKPVVSESDEKIRNQQFLEFADSDKIIPGTEIYAIGDPGNMDADSIIVGTIRDNAWAYNELPYESIVTDSAIRGGNSGCALLSKEGEIVGMVQFIVGNETFAGGINSNTLEFIVKKIIKGPCSSYIDEKGNFKSQYLGLSVGPYEITEQIILEDPSPELQGQFVLETKFEELPVGSILLKANGTLLHTNKIDRVILEDILWKSGIGDKITLEYKGISTNWKKKKITLTVVKMPCNLDLPFSFLSENSIVAPAYIDIYGSSIYYLVRDLTAVPPTLLQTRNNPP